MGIESPERPALPPDGARARKPQLSAGLSPSARQGRGALPGSRERRKRTGAIGRDSRAWAQPRPRQLAAPEPAPPGAGRGVSVQGACPRVGAWQHGRILARGVAVRGRGQMGGACALFCSPPPAPGGAARRRGLAERGRRRPGRRGRGRRDVCRVLRGPGELARGAGRGVRDAAGRDRSARPIFPGEPRGVRCRGRVGCGRASAGLLRSRPCSGPDLQTQSGLAQGAATPTRRAHPVQSGPAAGPYAGPSLWALRLGYPNLLRRTAH